MTVWNDNERQLIQAGFLFNVAEQRWRRDKDWISAGYLQGLSREDVIWWIDRVSQSLDPEPTENTKGVLTHLATMARATIDGQP